MKRVLLTLTGTVVGIVALLAFKTHSPGTGGPTGLPSAGLPSASAGSSAPSRSATTSGAPPNPTTSSYTGAAVTTRYGIVQVKVTVSDRKITNVSFAQLTAFDGHSARINADAAPILLQETLTAQSAQIQTVSGATYTSQGYQQSLQSALDKAGIK